MIRNATIHFFLNDGPVLSDWARILLYGYLFFDCYVANRVVAPGDSPFYAHLLFKSIHPLFWCIQNNFSRLFVVVHNYEFLKALAWICKISWLFCIFGFGGVISRTITGLTSFILSTTYIGIGKIGVSHRWYVPTWALLGLIFTKFQTLSVDFLINYYLNDSYSLEPNYAIFNSGFTSKFVQCMSIYSLFGGAITKLRLTGIKWVLPGTLTFYLSGISIEQYFILPKLRNILRIIIINNPLFVLFLSTSTLIMEIFSIAALFIQSTRFYLSAIACIFHFGVLIIQTPNFISQCVCYTAMLGTPSSKYQIDRDVHLFDWFFIIGGIMIIIGHVLSLIFKYEGWPFSWIPMFALDRREFTHDYILDENQLRSLADEFPLTNGISAGGEDHFSEGPSWIRITKNFEQQNIISDICKHVCTIEHAFRHSLSSTLMRSLTNSRAEMDVFLGNIFDLLLAKKTGIVSYDDFINVQIHFKDQGWTTYGTTKKKDRIVITDEKID